MFDTVLVANRGEIACRVIRTLGALGIRSVAVFSDADGDAAHVRAADLAVRIGPPPARDSYLDIGRIVDAARNAGAQAIHPGYGFLAESAAFARACSGAGLTFVGPPPEAIEVMGDKIRAKQAVEAAGVPVVPGAQRPGASDDELVAEAAGVGYPLLVKAAAGGGGKGMRIVREPNELAEALASARREAAGAFGDDALLLERYLERPRHIEVQVLADRHGEIVHLGERECSLQRRYQKVVEECPSPLLDAEQRERMGSAAIEVARACAYVGAGTVEFIVSGDDPERFYFLEMNTRLQVEHPVTEEVYGLDLVEWQLRVAAGESLAGGGGAPCLIGTLRPSGHAVEARIYAEDPARGFLPTGGEVLAAWLPAQRDGVRIDAGLRAGHAVTSLYDPLLAKVTAWGGDRDMALARLRRALGHTHIAGFTTNVGFLRALLADDEVAQGRLDTGLIERRLEGLTAPPVPDVVLAAAALARLAEAETDVEEPFDTPGGWRVGAAAWTRWRLSVADRVAMVGVRGRADDAEVVIDDADPLRARVELDGDELAVTVDGRRSSFRYLVASDVAWLGQLGGLMWQVRESDELSAARRHDEAELVGDLVAPMPGTVSVVYAEAGATVNPGQTLLVIEAMKMEHPITAPFAGKVAKLAVAAGQQVGMEELLAVVVAEDEAAQAPGIV